MLNTIHHAAIISSDYQTSKHFYTQILRLKVVAVNYRAEIDSYKLDLKLPDGGQIELFSFSNAPARSSYPEALGLRHLAFLVNSVEDVTRYLISQKLTLNPFELISTPTENSHSLVIPTVCHLNYTKPTS
jgi:glyoxylase I family protein